MVFLVFLTLGKLQGEIQFDFFPGFRENIVKGSAVPLAFEIYSDDAPINGDIFIRRTKNSRPMMKVPVEVAAGTRKRIAFPLIVPLNNALNSLVAELKYSGGEKTEIRENYSLRVHQRPAGLFLSVTDSPIRGLKIPDQLAPDPAKLNINNFKFSNHYGSMVSLRPEEFPDQVSLISGVFGVFINADVLTGLTEAQISALITWVENGGNLALSVSQAGELTQVNMVKNWLGVQPGKRPSTLDLKRFCQFYKNELGKNQTINSYLPNLGEVDASVPVIGLEFSTPHRSFLDEANQIPIVHRLNKGLGSVSVFPFDLKNSEITNWDGLPWVWVVEFNTQLVANYALDFRAKKVKSALNQGRDWNMDMDSLLDYQFNQIVNSSQIKKIPVFLLMAMLIVYLIIIGPADWIFLRKINRPMLTWITFPSAVIVFSLLIYFLGYTVRSGRTEWSAVHLFKMPSPDSGGKVTCRTYAGIYSPSNREYPVVVNARSGAVTALEGASQQPLTQLNPSSGNVSTELSVPVWVSEKFRFDYEVIQSPASGVDVKWDDSNPNEAQIVVTVPPDFPVNRFYLIKDGYLASVERGLSDVIQIPVGLKNSRFTNHYNKIMNLWRTLINDYRKNRSINPYTTNDDVVDPEKWGISNDRFLAVSTFSLGEFIKTSNIASSARRNSIQAPNYYSDSFLLPLGDSKKRLILVGVVDDYQNTSIKLGVGPSIRKEKGIYRWVINDPTQPN